jgi:hypothetical protein
VKEPPNHVGFKVLRYIVERSLSWLLRARRNARDYERLPENSEVSISWANIILMTLGSPAPKPVRGQLGYRSRPTERRPSSVVPGPYRNDPTFKSLHQS